MSSLSAADRARIAAWAAEQAAQAPPLSDEIRHQLQLLLGGKPKGVLTPRKPPVQPKWHTFIYRHYDSCGCLLYVGISYDAVKRNQDHERHSWWAKWSTRLNVAEEFYENRTKAEQVEKELIRTEEPAFNGTHSYDRDGNIVRYLIEHEQWEHLSVGSSKVSRADIPSLLRTLLAAGLLDRVKWHPEPIGVDQ